MRSRYLGLVVCWGWMLSCQGGQGPLSLEPWCQADQGSLKDDLVDVPLLPDQGTEEGRPDGAGGDTPFRDGEDVPLEPGTTGAPCESNRDCISGYCIEGIEGFVCTQVCVSECPEGWLCRTYSVGTDVLSLCTPANANLCRPCRTDLQCGDGLCMELQEGRFCSRDCSSSDCPENYECVEMTRENGQTSRQCRPVNGTCSCRQLTSGEERPCLRQNAFGTCLGMETCDPARGWVDCSARVPAAEVCNGADDDCNGVADD